MSGGSKSNETPPRLRVDKWLWHARFFKTRTLAAAQVSAGHVRINGVKVAKAAVLVGPGDVLTFAKEDDIRIIEVVAIGTRRGPAPEAQALYSDKSPPEAKKRNVDPPNPKFEGKGRPTKRDRRRSDLSRMRNLD